MIHRIAITVAFLLAQAASAFAQYSDGSEVYTNHDVNNQTEIYAVYRLNRITSNVGLLDSDFKALNLHGIGLGYAISRPFDYRTNLDYAIGADFAVSTSASHEFWNKTDNNHTWYHETATANLNTIIFKIPLSIGYSFHYSPKLITVRPFVGTAFNAHIFVRSKIKTTNNNGSSSQLVDLLHSDSTHESYCNLMGIDCMAGVKCSIGPHYAIWLSLSKYIKPAYKATSSYGETKVSNCSLELKVSKRM